MSKETILRELKQAVIDLEDDKVNELLDEGIKAGVPPMDLITKGLSPGLTEIGEGYEKNVRFMNDLVISGEIMNDAMVKLRPFMEKGGQSSGDVMVIGTVKGDMHNVGKRIVSALFTGAGYKVVDIGENMEASEFVKAAKELKATVVGASAILGPLKAYCKVINDALVDAGIRKDVIFIIGGWGMTEEWVDKTGADCVGENAVEAVNKVKAIRARRAKK